MKCLLTNDDGIDAPGIQALEDAVRTFGSCVIVAPSGPQSGVGHRVTTETPISVERQSEDRIAVDGTPVDCARLGLRHFAQDVEWVLSGINRGGNLGADFYPSGTLAAAREAALLGRPAIAISQYVARGRTIDWSASTRRALKAITKILKLGPEQGSYWNVNLPHPEDDDADCEIAFCDVDPSPMLVEYQETSEGYKYCGSYFDRPRVSSSDVDQCFSGKIAISRISLSIPGV